MLSPKLRIALLLLATGCVLSAQEPTFRSESNVVLVPALVKDEKGGIVYGLTAKDFIVEDDGAPQNGDNGVDATLRQKFAPRLLAQVLQYVQLLIELLDSPARSSFGNLLQPLAAMARIVHIPAGTADRPTAIQGLQAMHDPGKIFDHGQITSGQLAQHAYPGFAVVHGIQIMEAQALASLRASILSLLCLV